MSDQLPHISVSAIDKFTRCEWAWYDHYVQGNRGPATTALHFGSSMDETHNEAMRLVIEGKELPSPDDCEELFHSLWTAPPHDLLWDSERDPDKYGEIGRKMARRFREELYPTLKPVGVQERISIEFPDEGFSFLGFLDLREEGNRLADFKTSARSWVPSRGGPGKEIYQRQPPAYVKLFGTYVGEPVASTFRFYVGVKTKDPYIQTVERDVSDAEQAGFLRTMLACHRRMEVIRGGAPAVPCHQDVWWCSRRYCNAAGRCEAANGVRIKP